MIDLEHKEKWKYIPGFSNYQISSVGRIYNHKEDLIMSTSPNNYGNMKISLVADDGVRRTRSIAHMVAKAFVVPPTGFCTQVVLLDGNLNNVTADNIVWRPEWFAWKYARQMRRQQPNHYYNLRVTNLLTQVEYESIFEAGKIEGLLFSDIWRSTYTGAEIFPYNQIFVVSGENV